MTDAFAYYEFILSFNDINMSNDKPGTLKPILTSPLRFFTSKLSEVNDKRLQLNRSKGLAKYLAKSQKNIRSTAPLDTTLGVMSFSIYMLRFSSNIGLLVPLILAESPEKTNQKLRNDLYYSLLNDSLWCAVNLTQFFWLSFSNSTAAGFRGMQLETLAQLVDILITIVRYQHDKEEYDRTYKEATGTDQACLAIEWKNKQLNVLRSLLTGLSIAIVFGLFSFSAATVPLSPIISAIVLISSLLRVFVEIEKDKQLLLQLKFNQTNPQQLINKERAMTGARLKDINQIILNNVFLPLGFFLVITTPIPLAIIVCLSMLLINYVLTDLINKKYSPKTTALIM